MCFHVLFKNTVFVYFLVSKVKVLKIHVFYTFFIVFKIFVCILFVFSRFSLYSPYDALSTFSSNRTEHCVLGQSFFRRKLSDFCVPCDRLGESPVTPSKGHSPAV